MVHGVCMAHGRLLLRRVRRPVERHEDALGKVLRGVDRPQRRLSRALPLAVRVRARVAELEGEMHRDRLELWLLVAGHRLHVLVEPRVPPREGPDRKRAKRELGGRTAAAGQARLQQRVALIDPAHARHVGHRDGLRRAVGGAQPLLQPRAPELGAAHHLVEERLIVDILVEVLVALAREHRLAPLLHHCQRPHTGAEVDHASVEVLPRARPHPLGIGRGVELVCGHEDVCECDQGCLTYRLCRGVRPRHPPLPVPVEPHHVQVGDEHLVRVRLSEGQGQRKG